MQTGLADFFGEGLKFLRNGAGERKRESMRVFEKVWPLCFLGFFFFFAGPKKLNRKETFKTSGQKCLKAN